MRRLVGVSEVWNKASLALVQGELSVVCVAVKDVVARFDLRVLVQVFISVGVIEELRCS